MKPARVQMVSALDDEAEHYCEIERGRRMFKTIKNILVGEQGY